MNRTFATALTVLAFAVGAPLAKSQGLPAPKAMNVPEKVSLDNVKDIGKTAIDEMMQKFAAAKAAGNLKRFIVLPLQRDVDKGYFTLKFENAFTQNAASTGYQLYTRSDAALSTILGHIAWGQNYRDVLDPSTVQELGKLKDAQAILFPRVDITTDEYNAVTARVNLQVIEIATGQLHWGEETKQVLAGAMPREQMLWYGGIALAALVLLFIIIKFFKAAGAASRYR